MSKFSFGMVYCYTSRILNEWEKAVLSGKQDLIDRFRKEYLTLLSVMGWTEEEYDAELMKIIDNDWVKIYRRATFRLVITSNAIH